MADVYPDDGQHVADETWIARCGKEGWVAFSKDKNLAVAHINAIQRARAILFLLPDQSMKGREQTERYVHYRHRIAMRAKKGGPRVYKVYRSTVEQFWPR
jgi:hypothetical protein